MTRITPLLAAMMITGCSLLDPPLSMGIPRYDTAPGQVHAGNRSGNDTSLLVSAVRYGKGYDWRRDTAWNSAGSELVMFRLSSELFAGEGPGKEGPEEIVAIRTGEKERVSPGPDLHHIIGGHLYTEYSDRKGTSIGRDGTILFTYPEQEMLSGLLDTCGNVYTLGRNPYLGVMTYRKNGTAVLSCYGGIPFGGFGRPGYGPGGALYSCDGHICFGFRNVIEESGFAHCVTDGEETVMGRIGDFIALDCRVRPEGRYLLADSNGEVLMEGPGLECRYSREDYPPPASGSLTFHFELPIAYLDYSKDKEERTDLFCSLGFMWLDPTGKEFYENGGGLDFVREPDIEGFYYPSRNCGTVAYGELALALTPRSGGRPLVRLGKEEYGIDIEGFLSGIQIDVSPPTK